MRIAFTSKGTDWDSMMDPRFGRREFLLLFDEEKDDMLGPWCEMRLSHRRAEHVGAGEVAGQPQRAHAPA